MALSEQKIVDELNELIRYDFDAIASYEAAIDDIKETHIREPMMLFRGDHERHVLDLSAVVRRFGGEPVARPGFKGAVRKTMTKAAGLGGEELTLKAMRSNEEVMNRTYAHRLIADFPEDIKDIIRRNYADEQRHLAWFQEAILSRLWESGATVHP